VDDLAASAFELPQSNWSRLKPRWSKVKSPLEFDPHFLVLIEPRNRYHDVNKQLGLDRELPFHHNSSNGLYGCILLTTDINSLDQ